MAVRAFISWCDKYAEEIYMPRGKTSYKECEICNKLVSLFAFNRHTDAHLKTKIKKVNTIDFIQGQCRFCSKVYNNKIGLSNHETRCPYNQNRKLQILTEQGKQRIREKNKNRIYSAEWKAKHSEIMKKTVEKFPESYTASNRGRTKQYIIDDIKLIGMWEVEFYLWAKEQGLNPKRPTESFPYEWNGIRRYFPDFYIEILDLYIEVKGYETERDRSKWLQFTKKLRIIKKEDIRDIRNKSFKGL